MEIRLSSSERKLVSKANDIAFERMTKADPKLIEVGMAGKVIPGMDSRILLHSGPPLKWEDVQGPTRAAMIGAAIYEGWVSTPEDAIRKLNQGFVKCGTCYDYNAVGPMAGVISPSMPVFVVEDEQEDRKIRVFATINEGLGEVLRFGGLGEEVITRLKWIEKTLAPSLAKIITKMEPIKLKTIISAAIRRGDEVHNRNKSATSIFFMNIAAELVADRTIKRPIVKQILDFIASNPHFFLNLSMCAAKIMALSAHKIENSSIVTAMISNGCDFGITVSGTGNKWFKAPAPYVKAKYFEGFGDEDASPQLGDSMMTETAGYGGFALAASPAIIGFVGGTVEDGIEVTNRMRKICHGTNPDFVIPYLNYAGTPTGIDILKVCETGIVPIMDVGVAHKEPGKGQIGAGLVPAPIECFQEACQYFISTLKG